ncbi:MAG TPA: Calx-beta domain-containing protein [Actinoplanes sp.]|nr:Calx-beta domain-containing protein [Actinoplanes sp.]
MRTVIRLVTAAATAALGVLALVPTAQAAQSPTFTMGDTPAYEYQKDCSTQGPPFACPTSSVTMYVEIWTPLPIRRQATFGYAIDPITATQGVDYTGTTGTVVMAANTNFAFIAIPITNDGVSEPTETFRVRLTSSSIGGNISDTAIGSILNDGQIPADCTLSRPSLKVTSLACTNRPASQNWRFEITCYDSGGWGYVRAYGAIVTGNGTSTAECAIVDYEYGYPYFDVLP